VPHAAAMALDMLAASALSAGGAEVAAWPALAPLLLGVLDGAALRQQTGWRR
jgi:hypothetical protein